MAHVAATAARRLSAVHIPSGNAIEHSGPAARADTVEVHNALTRGTIDANVYRGGKFDTKLDLAGIVSADIVMTSGGPGADAQPFEFSLQNVVKA